MSTKIKTKNEVHLIARLGKDSEIKTFDSGAQICKITAATNNRFKSKVTGEWTEEVCWHTIVVKGNKAQEAARLRKGELIEINGYLKTRQYEHNNEKRYAVEVHCFDTKLLLEDGQPHTTGKNEDSFWNR